MNARTVALFQTAHFRTKKQTSKPAHDVTSPTVALLLVYQNGAFRGTLYSAVVRGLKPNLRSCHNRPHGSTKRGLRAFVFS